MKTELKDLLHLYLGCEMTDGRILYSVDADGEWMLLAPNGVGCTNFRPEWDESVKPILHRLEDMTEEHLNELKPLMNSASKGKNMLPIIRASRLLDYFFNAANPNIMLFLLKNGYDIFGLIDSGQAIDYKTLNQQ